MIILLNGPPRSGKDYAGRVFEELGATTYKFATEVKDRTHAIFRLHVPTDHFEDVKDDPRSEFLGATPREAYIRFSEGFMKPLYGDDIFGRLLAQRIRPGVAAVTDSGFVSEAKVLVDQFDDVVLVRIHRDGYDFSGDSRSYINLEGKCIDINNTGPNFRSDLREIYTSLVEPS